MWEKSMRKKWEENVREKERERDERRMRHDCRTVSIVNRRPHKRARSPDQTPLGNHTESATVVR